MQRGCQNFTMQNFKDTIMNAKVLTTQETFYIPEDAESSIDEIAAIIDHEIALERRGTGEEIIKINSVSIVYGDEDNKIQFPFVKSGAEFRDHVKRLEKFNRIK